MGLTADQLKTALDALAAREPAFAAGARPRGLSRAAHPRPWL